MKSLTPAMRQYLEIKRENSDSILFFRMGDFYEMFFDDAILSSRVLGIALTSRDKAKDIPMCGIPYHSASSYVAKLVKEGHKVAICEQVEDPGVAKGIVERAVVKVITPGIALDEELLDPKSNNFIASAFINNKRCGFSYMDVSTGEFRLTELSGMTSLKDEVRRIRPLEMLVQEGLKETFTSAEFPVKKITTLPEYDFEHKASFERLITHFGIASLDGFGCKELVDGTRAAGALLQYIKDTQRAALVHVKKCAPYSTEDYLVMDSSTRRNLEIMENMRSAGKEGTLLELLDKTSTAMGGRRLKSWLLHPLKDAAPIRDRQDAVAELLDDREKRRGIKALLNSVYDLERLSVKVSLGAAGPRDLIALKESLKIIPEIREAIASFGSAMLKEAASSIDEVREAVGIIDASIKDNPPVFIRDGGVIKNGCNPLLDELREIGSGGKDWIIGLEASERARTGINSLKVGYNRVFGYYIEITRANLQSVPADYIRKQTLTGAERYITPALKEWEEKILSAEEKAVELEINLFSGIVKELGKYSERVRKTADVIALLDVLSSFADIAEEMDYARPLVNNDDIIAIEGGRHPVVEKQSRDGFVANDLTLDNGSNRIIILTGPNMAGKSTYLRQNALIILMAQIGSFVPASKATIGAVDRIFTRVGASDDLARGQSTFMVEMNETANILNNATSRSFVILDEIGRGTSTFDGLSIAWSIVEYIHDHPDVAAKTLFATHYHELTDLSLTRERVKNYNMAVKEWGDKIIFLRKVVPGGSSRSYGIQVARLAGLPEAVLSRAREILKNLESGELNSSGVPRLSVDKRHEGEACQLSLLGDKDPLRERLRALDVNSITPIEAMMELNKLKEMMEN
ncbi:MAG: DNA mismatch repair protein MutS [Deltaproteobacteria bacterium]|nr:DNA mismatch repair protein MutS [Deltaproteobacteria bacterium]